MSPGASTMRAAVYHRYGGPEVVSLAEVPRPTPGAGEVLVRTHATTVSSADSRVRALRVPAGFGLFARPVFGVFGPRRAVLGTELAGVVEAVGPGVTAFAVGDRVVAATGMGMGCHAEYRVLPVTGCIARLPTAMPLEEAAALAFGGMTALHYLRDAARTRAGERVLVIGAAGTVGSAAVQLARHLGAHVTAVTSARHLAAVQALAPDAVIDHTAAPVLAPGATYDVIFDAVGRLAYRDCRAALAPGGRLILCAGSVPQILGSLLRALGSGHRIIAGPAPERPAHLAELVTLAATGAFRPLIDRTYPLAQITAAHAHVDAGHKQGSVVITL